MSTLLNPKDHAVGRIYLIGTKKKGDPVKIGVSSLLKIEKRLCAIQCSHWEKLHFIHISDDLKWAINDEAKLHEKYSNLRVRGEWFKLTKKEIDEIKAIYP